MYYWLLGWVVRGIIFITWAASVDHASFCFLLLVWDPRRSPRAPGFPDVIMVGDSIFSGFTTVATDLVDMQSSRTCVLICYLFGLLHFIWSALPARCYIFIDNRLISYLLLMVGIFIAQFNGTMINDSG